jgi:hypothetical protein
MTEGSNQHKREQVDFLTLNERIRQRLCIGCGLVKVPCVTCLCEQCKRERQKSQE